jgi:lipid II:glycine glycyltransferase (peptidoglycan interpeptide bridge formation enzyme)
MHGASDNAYRNLMPTYLLQYRAIIEAKKMGCILYDFGGVVAEDDIDHSWSGISRFKRGFGGEEAEYIGAFDFPYSKSSYKLFSLTSDIRRKIKGA